MSNDGDMVMIRQRVNYVTTAAHRYGALAALGEEYQPATELHAAAKRLATRPAPQPPAPPTPDKIESWCVKVATARERHANIATVAEQVAAQAERTALSAAYNAAERVAQAVADFANGDDVLPRLVELLRSAPHQLTGAESDEQMAQHRDLLQACTLAYQCVSDMANLAIVTEEATNLGPGGELFLACDPSDNASMLAIKTALRAFQNTGIPHSVEGWAPLLHIGIRAAQPGEATRRADRYRQALAAGMSTPDGGTLTDTRTVGQMLAFVGQPMNVALALSQ